MWLEFRLALVSSSYAAGRAAGLQVRCLQAFIAQDRFRFQMFTEPGSGVSAATVAGRGCMGGFSGPLTVFFRRLVILWRTPRARIRTGYRLKRSLFQAGRRR